VLCSWVELCEIGGAFSVLLLCSEYGTDILSQYFSKFDTPLIEAVDAIKETFDGDSVLVEGEKLATVVGSEWSAEENAE